MRDDIVRMDLSKIQIDLYLDKREELKCEYAKAAATYEQRRLEKLAHER